MSCTRITRIESPPLTIPAGMGRAGALVP